MIDVQGFERSLSEADTAEQRGETDALRPTLEHALAVYQGDLLPGCYDDWIAPERERLRRRCHFACHKLMNILENQRDYAAALQTAWRLLQLDPLDEAAYGTPIRLHSLNDDYAGARRVYQTAVETLRREMDVGPGEALRAAYKRLQHPPRTLSSFGDDAATSAFKLVGRQVEWRQAQAVWQRAAGGDAHLLLSFGVSMKRICIGTEP